MCFADHRCDTRAAAGKDKRGDVKLRKSAVAFLALENTVEEIAGKIAAGVDLMPDMAVEPSPRSASAETGGTAFKAGSPVPD